MALDHAARLRGRRILAIFIAVFGIGLIGAGGSLLPTQQAAPTVTRVAQAGRTTSVCAVNTPAADQPTTDASTTSVSAVSVPGVTDTPGILTTAGLDGAPADLSVSQLGKGGRLESVKAPVVLTAEGAMAPASVGSVWTVGLGGTDAGLAAAPCGAPSTSAWFSGLGSEESDRTELVLSDPDDTQAEVDLKFYGRNGRVVVPGSPGVVVDAHSSRTVSLSGIVATTGALGLSVEASQGRVSAITRRLRSDQLEAAGVDWAVPTASPRTTVLIPGVPGEAGTRELVVTNPTVDRATVSVSVLGLQGSYVPVGAEQLAVPAESTAVVALTEGMSGEAGTVVLTSDRPVTGAVISQSQLAGAKPDLAVQVATAPLVKVGVSAVATTGNADSELVVSNAGGDDVSVTFDVLSYDGVSLRRDDLLLAAGSTATRRLTSPAPSYVVVEVPEGSSVVGGVVFTGTDDKVAGLATLPLVSPDVAARAPRSVADPTVGR